MKKENNEFSDYIHVRHVAQKNEKYFLTIVDESGLRTVNLGQFEKNQISFGKSFKNDIVLTAEACDLFQGYLEINEHGVLVVNTSESVKMITGNDKEIKSMYLAEQSFAKIVNTEKNNDSEVLMLISINKNLDEWKQFTLPSGKTTVGSSGQADIIVSPRGVAEIHASIHKSKDIFVRDEASMNGTYVNGQKIPMLTNVNLNNLDIILVGNSKLILCNNSLYYQIFGRGIRLDAVDIVKNVKIKFKTKTISSHVNMTINPCEFVAFVGGSGAGKSTFLKCISGVDKPTSGEVYLNGENLYENYESLKYNIGYVPQDDIVFSNLTLHDMLVYSAKLRMPSNTSQKERLARIRTVLDIVDLAQLENSYIRQLSGGQRKRASIAVELLADPNLFFLDEPTSGLDPGTERSIMETLRKMSEMGKTIILVTHNTLNLHLCDKVAFFGQGGHLCFYGSPQEAFEFFGVDDFVDIYTLISENMNLYYEKYKALNLAVEIKKEKKSDSNKIKNNKKPFLKQLIILIKRYIKLIFNDFQQLLLLVAQAPIVSLLLSVCDTSGLYTSYDNTKSFLFALGCASIWLGLLNSIQEICKEKVIVQKEHMADLKISTYILSKFIVQAILAFIQAFTLVFMFQKLNGQSEYNILLGSFWDIQFICFLSILSSATLGLFISALVKNTNVAMTLVPLILVSQLLFSGMLFKLEGATKFISNFILCRWTMEGLGTSVNLNELTRLSQTMNPLIEIEPEDYFTFTVEHMLQDISVIVFMTVVLLVLCYIALKKNVNKNL